jgi:hypothetical protein
MANLIDCPFWRNKQCVIDGWVENLHPICRGKMEDVWTGSGWVIPCSNGGNTRLTDEEKEGE